MSVTCFSSNWEEKKTFDYHHLLLSEIRLQKVYFITYLYTDLYDLLLCVTCVHIEKLLQSMHTYKLASIEGKCMYVWKSSVIPSIELQPNFKIHKWRTTPLLIVIWSALVDSCSIFLSYRQINAVRETFRYLWAARCHFISSFSLPTNERKKIKKIPLRIDSFLSMTLLLIVKLVRVLRQETNL